MLLIRCPFCEEARPEIEFRYAGEAHIARPVEPQAATDSDWAAYLYVRGNPKGWHAERWHHVHGCGRFFNALRNTVSDCIAATYRPGDTRPALPAVDRSAEGEP